MDAIHVESSGARLCNGRYNLTRAPLGACIGRLSGENAAGHSRLTASGYRRLTWRAMIFLRNAHSPRPHLRFDSCGSAGLRFDARSHGGPGTTCHLSGPSTSLSSTPDRRVRTDRKLDGVQPRGANANFGGQNRQGARAPEKRSREARCQRYSSAWSGRSRFRIGRRRSQR